MSNTVKFSVAPVAALALNVAASLKTREEEKAAKAAADAAAKAAKAAAKAAKSGKADDTSSTEATSLDKMVALTSSLSLADLVSLVAYRTASDDVVDPGTVIDTVGELVDSCVEAVNSHLSQTYALTMYVKAILYTEITTALQNKPKGGSVSKEGCILAASMAASAQIDSEVLLAAGVKSASELRAFVERVAATLIGTSEEDGKPFASARRVGLFATNHFRSHFAEFGEKYNAFINPPSPVQEVSEAAPVQDDASSLVDESDTDSDASVDDASHNDLR